MDFAVYETKFGNILVNYKDDVVFALHKTDKSTNEGNKTEFTDLVISQINEYFSRKRKQFDFKYKLIGTDFQLKVWKALENIPYGETRSYKDIAIAVGNEKASRAVGMANNKNPIFIVVPCHRVIGANGTLTGYAGGLHMKQALLDIEKRVD